MESEEPVVEAVTGEPEKTGEEQSSVPDEAVKPDEESPKPEEAQAKVVPLKALEAERRKRHQLEQEADYWRQQVISTRPQLEGQPKETKSNKPPEVDDYENYEDFIVAQARFAARQELETEKLEDKKRQEAARKRDAQKSYQDKISAAYGVYPDFDDVLTSANDIEMPQEALDAIVESDSGEHITYFLAKNRDEAKRFAAMPQAQRLKMVGRLEARFEKQKEAPPKRISMAPNPINPVSTHGEATQKDPSKMTDDEWYRYRRAEKAAQYKR